MRRNNSMELGLVTPSRNRSTSLSQTNFPYPTRNAATAVWTDDSCLSRVPYASLVAFLLCFMGVVLFSTMMIWAFNASVEQTRRALDITDIPWLDKVQIAFIIVAIVMAAVAFTLLILGVLGTGSTREAVYKRENARRGGRFACVIGMITAYFLNAVWMLVLCTVAIIIFVYYLFSELCSSLTVYSESSCLDLSVFRPLVSSISESKLMLCGGSAQQFCALTSTVIIWYLAGFAGSFLICLGLIQFIAANASNCSNIRNERRNSEMQDLLYAELNYPAGHTHHQVLTNGSALSPFRVDYNPTMTTHNQGTLQPKTYPLPPMLTAEQQYHLNSQPNPQPNRREANLFGDVPRTFAQRPHALLRNSRPCNSLGNEEVSRVRRNSYHNLFDENNGWVNTIY